MNIIVKFFSRLTRMLGVIALLLILAIGFTTFGYKSSNEITKVADIKITPTQPQEFKVRITWLDGQHVDYQIKGDQFYIDAKILKWKDWLGFLGIKTWYELDRIGGRYISIVDEQNKERSIFQLATDKEFDLYNLRKQYQELSFLVDAEYGSAVFMLADTKKDIELLVARTGLTIKIKQFDDSPELIIN